ncbi:hypothetical protein AMTR_s00085p00144560 [Amborella trichopoda]|uniref:Uncharacterized protein n=1 Tax=Amborella trichopoda TaxID=13333 RepID=W1P476_AMBTC|nr:hypothetical protein AMTR_s00085p00144560 [Amborella trichopoda]
MLLDLENYTLPHQKLLYLKTKGAIYGLVVTRRILSKLNVSGFGSSFLSSKLLKLSFSSFLTPTQANIETTINNRKNEWVAIEKTSRYNYRRKIHLDDRNQRKR